MKTLSGERKIEVSRTCGWSKAQGIRDASTARKREAKKEAKEKEEQEKERRRKGDAEIFRE